MAEGTDPLEASRQTAIAAGARCRDATRALGEALVADPGRDEVLRHVIDREEQAQARMIEFLDAVDVHLQIHQTRKGVQHG